MSDLTRFRSDKAGKWSSTVWDGLIEAIAARFAPLEEQLGIQRSVTEAIVARGLAVIEAELAPLVEQGGDRLGEINQIKADALVALAVIEAMETIGIPIANIIGLADALTARLEKAQNLNDLPNKSTARSNLGANDAANLTAGTVADSRLPVRLGPYASAVTDWNDAVTNGWFMSGTAANAPAAGWFMGQVVAHNTLYCTQTLHLFTADSSADTNLWRREFNNGTWGAWYRLRVSQAELDARYVQPGSAVLTGTPTAPTAAPGTNTGQLANTAFVQAAVAALIASAPGVLDTLDELAAALGDDANFAATVTTALNARLEKAQNLNDLANKATARSNLGANDAANLTAGTIPDARLPARLGTESSQPADWNNAVANGYYRGANIPNAPTNAGASDWYEVRVHAHTSTYVEQLAWNLLASAAADTLYYRRLLINGVWGSWHRLRWSEAELDTRYSIKEAGDWTPTFQGSTVVGSISYDLQIGKYVAAGRMVTVNFDVEAGAFFTTSPTGSVLLIANLPFAADQGSQSGGGSISGAIGAINIPANFAGWSVRLYDANRLGLTYQNSATGGMAYANANILTSDTRFIGSLTYRRA